MLQALNDTFNRFEITIVILPARRRTGAARRTGVPGPEAHLLPNGDRYHGYFRHLVCPPCYVSLSPFLSSRIPFYLARLSFTSLEPDSVTHLPARWR